ncbi:MAG: hypothetical protein GF308_15030 [Candidatus Heimdallarchaeota archaeon]|nr:hypothetical protein [Candidatus Heimdallarchaeota archaeon]
MANYPEQKPSQQSHKDLKKIEKGILETIAKISDENEWSEGLEGFEVQAIITQLARSAALFREKVTELKEQEEEEKEKESEKIAAR